jgi:hypothetical protein
MASPNPFVPPKTSPVTIEPAPPPDDPTPWRLQGDTLLVRRGATLPEICVFTGAPAPGGLEREQVSWTPIWFKVLAVLAPIIAVFAYSAVRRSSTLELALGGAAKRRRRNASLVGLAGLLSGLFLFVLSAWRSDPGMFALAALVFVVAVSVAALRTRVFGVLAIDRQHVRLKLTPAAADAFARLQAASPPHP